MVVGMIVLGVAVWALVKGQPPRMRIPNRKIAGWVLAGSLAVGATGSALAPPEDGDTKVVTSGVATAGVIPSEPKAESSPTTTEGTTTASTDPTTTTTAEPVTITTAEPATATTTAKATATTTARPTTTTTRRTTTTTRPMTATTTPARSGNCDPSYPDICIPAGSADLDCPEIPYRNFRVVGSDPHRFDADHDGIGCERN